MNQIDVLIKKAKKVFGSGSLVRASDARAIVEKRISTGLLRFDFALGGGLPLGKIMEFVGKYSSGKTTICYEIVQQFQSLGRTCAFIDAEHSFSPHYASSLGVNVEDLLIAQPQNQEEAIDMIEVLIREKSVSLIILDSVSGLIPTHVLGRSADEPTMGVEAKLNNLLMRKVVAALAPGDLTDPENAPWCSLILVNQLRANMSMYGVDEGGGGYGMKFFKHISVEFRRSQWLGKNGEPVAGLQKERYGQTISYICKKNKTSSPFGKGEIDFYWKRAGSVGSFEFDKMKEVLELAVQFGIVEQRGSWFGSGATEAQGKDGFISLLRERKDVLNFLKSSISERIYRKRIVRKERKIVGAEVVGEKGKESEEPEEVKESGK